MPSPVGHALGGLIVGSLIGRERHERQATNQRGRWAALSDVRVLCVIAACVPDIDFAWARHNMETHSLGFAVLVGLVVLMWRRSWQVAIACTLAAATHVLFDWLGSDDTPPLGVMALWPFSNGFYFANAFVFEAISRRYWLPGFVMHNLLAVVREVAILGPITAMAVFVRRNASVGPRPR